MVDIGFSKFVALETTVFSTAGLVSVLTPLELVPGISVGVLAKIFPLKIVVARTHQEDHVDFEDQRVPFRETENPEHRQ